MYNCKKIHRMNRGSKTLSTSYLVKQLPSATVFIDKTFSIVHASDKWIGIFSQNEVDIFGKNLFVVLPELSTKWKKVLENCFDGKSGPMGVEKVTENGVEKWFEWSTSSWYDDKENIIGAIIQSNDITDTISNELKLDKVESLLKHQSEISQIGSWEYNIIENTVEWCAMTKTIHEVETNYKPNIETSINFYKEGHSRNAISMAIFEAMEKGTPWNLKLQIITAKGTEKWVRAAGKAIYRKRKLVCLMGTFQDIDEQVISNLETKNNEKLLKTLIDNLPLNVYIKDTESRKILANKAECDYLGVKDPKEILGKSDFDLYPAKSATLSREEDLKVLQTLKPIISKETVNIKKDGTETAFLSSKIPLIDHTGNSYGLVGISLDITDLKQKEKELRNLINVTSQQNKKLINFAHIVSHNLRSHSANFSMLLNFLVEETNEEEKEGIIKMLMNASGNLLETLDNLNEVVAISSNVNITKQPTKLFNTVTKVKQNLSGFLLNNKAQIITKIPKNLKLNVVPSYLESILLNFITNGVKYKHPQRDPQLTLSVSKLDKQVLLSIEDNGLGIDLKKYGNKLFGMYKTFHSHEDARGIGLYITKNQIEAMGGKITVESKVGQGTKFIIFFNDEN